MIETSPHRVAIVTGGAEGIGWATALRFAMAGDRVAILDRNGASAMARAAELGEGHLGLEVDMGVEEGVVAGISAVASKYGRVDVLVNNAGIVDADATPMLEKRIDDFRRLLAVNLEGAFVAAREAGRIMMARGGGAIVNVVSVKLKPATILASCPVSVMPC